MYARVLSEGHVRVGDPVAIELVGSGEEIAE
jgi:MOSC domain-containing protein YiiM